MYRDLQENTINSDVGCLILGLVWNVDRFLGCGLYCSFLLQLHDSKCLDVLYFNLSRQSLKNDELTRHRMKDAIASVINEECYGM